MDARIVSTLLILSAITSAQPLRAQLAAPNDTGVSFGHVHLNVADVALQKTLWTMLFDGVVIEREGYVAVRLPGTLLFFRDAEPSAPSKGSAMDHIGLKVKDMATVLARWRSLGYEVDLGVVDEKGSPVAHITMPDGATLELSEDKGILTTAEMDHVHYSALRTDSLVSWYGRVFGAVPEYDGKAETIASVPGSKLIFSTADSSTTPIEGTAIDHIGFEVRNVEAFAEKLRGEGVEIEFGPRYFESIDLWVAFFTDHSGVLVEITQGLDW